MRVKFSRIGLNGRTDQPSLAVFWFLGNTDPVKAIDSAIECYVENKEFYEFVDDNMDNPWIRVVLKDIEGFEKVHMIVEGIKFDVYKLHKSGNVEVVFISCSDNANVRPQPLINLALMQYSHYRGYNSFIDSDISDLWSRLVIIGINDLHQVDYNGQKI